MFPWSPEFVWDTGHVVFFGALYSVLAAIAGGLAVAGWRSFRAQRAGQADALAWHADFEDLPRSARACRHCLTGEARGRVCDNAFDCRSCAQHPALEVLRACQAEPAVDEPLPLGLELPPDRLYHRGHTWVRPEADGSVSVGLDDMARRLVGTPQSVELPVVGEVLREHAPLARLQAHGSEARLLSPVAGTVLAVEGAAAGFSVRLAPVAPLDSRHLLCGREARLWTLRELERLQRALAPVGTLPALADGGELVADVGAAVPRERYDALLGEMFLEP
jgi:hypothetical protein